MSTIINASTSSGLVQTADTSGTLELQSNGTTQLTVSSTGAYGQLKSGTAVASTSGTSINFTSLPSWVKRITVILAGVSTNGTSTFLLQLGDSGGIENTGYASQAQQSSSSGTSTAGFLLTFATSAATLRAGTITVCLISGNTWVSSSVLASTDNTQQAALAGGTKTLSDTLTQLRITTTNGTDTFDAGSINILYEG